MKKETFEKTTRKPLDNFFCAIIAVSISITVLSLPIIVTLINTKNTAQNESKVASINSAFSKCWEEFVRVMDENYSYVILYPSNEDYTEIQGYVKDTDLEKDEITFYEAVIDNHLEEYINGNRTYTIRKENVQEMYVYKNDRLMKRVKTIEK